MDQEPSRRWSKRALLSGAAAAVVGIVAAADAFLRAPRDVLRFEYIGDGLSDDGYRKLADHGWTTDSFDVAPGVTLRGLKRKPSAPGAPWLLFFPGNGGDLLRDSQIFLDALRGDHDWGIAVYAYRGFDGSGGISRREGIVGDAVPTFRHLVESEHLAPKQVHVVGFSLGTHLATVAASSLGAEGPASLTLVAPLTAIDIAPRSPFRRWTRADRYDTRPLLDTLRVPVLIVHGSSDLSLPVVMGREIAQRLGDRARFVEIKEKDHKTVLTSEETFDAVRGFIASPHAH